VSKRLGLSYTVLSNEHVDASVEQLRPSKVYGDFVTTFEARKVESHGRPRFHHLQGLGLVPVQHRRATAEGEVSLVRPQDRKLEGVGRYG
jgi:hypothetical protein